MENEALPPGCKRSRRGLSCDRNPGGLPAGVDDEVSSRLLHQYVEVRRGLINPDRSESARCRVILLVHDLRDNAVSNDFQVTRRAVRFDGDIAKYLRWPRGSVDGMLRCYHAWAGQRTVQKGFLVVRYPDRQHDAPRELQRIAAFVGMKDVRDATIPDAVEYASFGARKRREAQRPADASVLAPGRAGDAESFKTRKPGSASMPIPSRPRTSPGSISASTTSWNRTADPARRRCRGRPRNRSPLPDGVRPPVNGRGVCPLSRLRERVGVVSRLLPAA